MRTSCCGLCCVSWLSLLAALWICWTGWSSCWKSESCTARLCCLLADVSTCLACSWDGVVDLQGWVVTGLAVFVYSRGCGLQSMACILLHGWVAVEHTCKVQVSLQVTACLLLRQHTVSLQLRRCRHNLLMCRVRCAALPGCCCSKPKVLDYVTKTYFKLKPGDPKLVLKVKEVFAGARESLAFSVLRAHPREPQLLQPLLRANEATLYQRDPTANILWLGLGAPGEAVFETVSCLAGAVVCHALQQPLELGQ